MPAWARISRASGNSSASCDGVQTERGDPAAGVDQDGQRALVRERDDRVNLRVVERELLGARVELDPLRAGGERALGLGHGIVVRVDAAERNEQTARVARGGEHVVVGGAVAVGLVERERERAPGAGER